jgi:ABC-type phosphate/phosphonate transport system substrate-binding protein
MTQADNPTTAALKGPPRVLRIGAVAYSPDAVTIWRGIRHYFAHNQMPIDYVLYSNYDALVKALRDGHVDLAWNTPLAHARYHLLCGGQSQALVMRDVDQGYRCTLIVRKDTGIASLRDLPGQTVVFGSCDAAEATVLPVYFLRKEGVSFERIKVVNLHDEVDERGSPCNSERHVFMALQKGRGTVGVISENYWKRLQARQPDEAKQFQAIWTSPPFTHCVFTASKDFDRELGARFTKLMLAMDSKDPITAEVLRLEGARRWIAGSQEGFESLVEALQSKEPVPYGRK